MKRTLRLALIVTLWAGSLWIVFWLGFLKSQTIASHTQHLGDLRLLLDQKALLAKLGAGEVSSVRDELQERISIGESLSQMQASSSYGIFDTLSYAVYPHEALSLIRVSNSKENAPKK